MLYRIENAYQDYKTVKVNVSSQGYFLQKIVQIIKEKCREIELIKPSSGKSEILEKDNVNYIVDKEKGKITCYPNERVIFEALISLGQEEPRIGEEYKLYQKGLEEVLLKGNIMNNSEVIRDFNGWSWDITTSQMESKNLNLIYQNLTILLGKSFLQNWVTGDDKEEIEEAQIPNNEILRSKYNDSFGMTKEEVQENVEIDYIKLMEERLIENYGENQAIEFLNQLKKVLIAIGYNRDEEQKSIILEEKEETEHRLERMQNNTRFLEEISQTKKNLTKEIKEIDKLLADDNALKEEYDDRNSRLPNKEKIFSVSHLKIMLEKERDNKLEEIKDLNRQMQPAEFVKTKNQLTAKRYFFDDIGIDKTIDEERLIDRLQILFLECILQRIKRVETKQEIKEIIYELRYYEQLPYKEFKVSNIEIIQEKLRISEREILQKACKDKILITFTKQDILNVRLLSNQFRSKMINLENMTYILRYSKGILRIEIYDIDVEDDVKEIELTDKVELQVKLNRKIKLWE